MPDQNNDLDLTWVANLIYALADFSDPECRPDRITKKIKKVRKEAIELVELAREWERGEILADGEHCIQKIIAGAVLFPNDDEMFLETGDPSEIVDFLFANGVIPETREKDRDKFIAAISAPRIDSMRQCALDSGDKPKNYFERAYLDGSYSVDNEEQGPKARHLARFGQLGIVTLKQGRDRRRLPPVSRYLWKSRNDQVSQAKTPQTTLIMAIVEALYTLAAVDFGNIDLDAEFGRTAKTKLRKLSERLTTSDELDIAHEAFHQEFSKWITTREGRDTFSKLSEEKVVSDEDLERSRKVFFDKIVECLVPLFQEYLKLRAEHLDEPLVDNSRETAGAFVRRYLDENLRLTPYDFRFFEYHVRRLIPDELGRAYLLCLSIYADFVGKRLKKRLERILNEDKQDLQRTK